MIPLESLMTPRGHLTAHMPQQMHPAGSITGFPSSTVIAPAGHSLSHIRQAMHELSHASRAVFPRSRLLHFGCILLSGNMISMRFCGQARTQSPQPTHLSLSTEGGPPSTTLMAARWQAASHEPPPRHPYLHLLIPSGYKLSIALQSRGSAALSIPSSRGLPPLQRTYDVFLILFAMFYLQILRAGRRHKTGSLQGLRLLWTMPYRILSCDRPWHLWDRHLLTSCLLLRVRRPEAVL